ncbi:MAG: 4Fe-4S dicluster domain-containing protein [Pseudomonadota bacterium]
MTMHNSLISLAWTGGPKRPPGSLPELLFRDQCQLCSDCAAVCPQGIILLGSDGFPELAVGSRGCTGCGLCAEICTPQAILPM